MMPPGQAIVAKANAPSPQASSPAASRPADLAGAYVAGTSAGQPQNLTLDSLRLRFEKNVYFAGPGQGRFGWADGQGSDLTWLTAYRGPGVRVWYAEGQAKAEFMFQSRIDAQGNRIGERNVECHQLQIQDFANAIRENREPAVSAEEGRKAIEIIMAIYQSGRTGQPIKFPFYG